MVTKPLSKDILDSVEREALVNAQRHAGKADSGAVIGRILGQYPDLRSDPSAAKSEVGVIVGRVNSLSSEAQGQLLREKYPGAEKAPEKEARTGLPPLAGAVSGKTAFRLPPEPSGYMTIGHAMAFNINYLYKEMYSGELWLRFEDTNPRKAAKMYYDNFRRGIDWLGIRYDHEKNVSDDIELMYEYGRRMVSDGLAYACSCDAVRVKAMRFEGKTCEHRERPAEESLDVWDGLVSKRHREGEFVVRFKGDMSSLDYSLRDPNLFRVIEHSHPLTGDKYTLWPTYDLANTIEDEICGITHVLRSSEFHNDLQRLIREKLRLRPVQVVQFSRFNFKGTPVGKRLLRPLVEQGLVSGWDDPRMPTVDGVRKRGILPEAFRLFTLQVGYTKTEHEYDWSLLYAVNRKLLDPISRRIFFVPRPVRLHVEGSPKRTVKIPYHPDKNLGDRTVQTSEDFFVPGADLEGMKEGQVFRLMDLCNVELTSKREPVRGRYAGDGLIQETKKVQWVADPGVGIKVAVAGSLFDDSGNFDKAGLQQVDGLAEKAVSDLNVGDVVQFPRFGFCRVDSPGAMIMTHK